MKIVENMDKAKGNRLFNKTGRTIKRLIHEQSLFCLVFLFLLWYNRCKSDIRSKANGKAKEKQTIYDVSETIAYRCIRYIVTERMQSIMR